LRKANLIETSLSAKYPFCNRRVAGKWDNPDVVKYLNQIRERAGMPDVDLTEYNNEEKMRELYRRERRIELAFEGHRLFDIRRWK
jgi:hypothetical protein